ncbi:MAG: penicillin-binding protein 1C [Verrucomicrobia bacterium]|jgi:penicillin-binding protein 1C|nr:MAG: penicillin-binding protein 1C [Verrucomicrobiota bacterium]
MKRLWKIVAWTGATLAAAVVFFLWLLPLLVQLPVELLAPPRVSTTVTDRNEVPLRRFLVNGEEVVASYVPLSEIPQDFIDATVAAEDKRFWTHHGIDFIAVLRAANQAAEEGQAISGASTISQQLIKITMPEPMPRNLRTKLVEIILARKLEMTRDKRWILENYLNRIPYGNLRTGCRAAAEGYFAKPLSDLTLAECSLLAGLPNKPTRFNPYRNFKGAKERQVWILDRMREDGYITAEECERAKTERLVLRREGSAFRAPHAVDLIVTQHRDALGPGTVRSTIDQEMQSFAESVIDEHLNFISSQRSTSRYFHAAVVAIDNATGDVLVLTGSRNYEDQRSGQINGAWIPRSPGSALKPFTYLIAMQRGIPATTVLADIPVEFPTPLGVYRPVNYDRTWMGPVDIRRALGNSLNVPAVRMLDQIGGPEALHHALTGAGLTSLTEPASTYGLGLTIGSAPVRLLELTNAYASLARLGEFKPWRLLLDAPPALSKRLFDEDACFILAEMLSDNSSRARNFGWNNPLHFNGFRAAAKTGTSSDFRDGWTVGFTPEFTVGVWVGNFDHTPLDRFSGTAGAGPIFHAVMERLHRDRPATWYHPVDGVARITVDRLTGHQTVAGISAIDPQEVPVLRRAMPRLACREDYDGNGRVILPTIYSDWHRTAPGQVRQRTTVRTGPETVREFQIRCPVEGLVVYLDPDLPDSGSLLRLSADIEGMDWSSPTLHIDRATQTAQLTPGTHEITAEDPVSGMRRTVRILVKQA